MFQKASVGVKYHLHGLCEVVDVLIHKRLKEIKKNPLFSYPLTSSLELLKTV